MKQGQQQQRYRVIERLAAGGMAEVFLAESAGIEGFKKRVAIKRVLPHLSEKKRFIAMFLDEARLSAHLTHSNVAQVFDIGVGDNAYFIVMEYVDGSDLKAVLEFVRSAKNKLPIEVIAHIGEKICEGLAYAHEAKGSDGQPLRIVHRDVSPANVLITKYGEIKIVDFGLAKATSQLEKSEPGIVKGKFGYLSPEATLGVEVDARADVFAVGIILWEMLAQKRLFLGENDLQTVLRVREAVVPPLAPLNKDVPPELEKIIQKALAKDPEKRFQTARELGRAINGFLFKYGKPVGAHDVADLVHGTVALRRTTDKEKDTTLSRLIEEALLQFKSLDDDQQSGRASTADKNRQQPLADEPRGRVSHFEDIGKWAEEVDALPASGGAKSIRPPPPSVEPKPASEAAATVKATPGALAQDAEEKPSEPAETVKATPGALAPERDEARAEERDAAREEERDEARESEDAEAGPTADSTAESVPADTVKSAAEDDEEEEQEELRAKSTPRDKPSTSEAAPTIRATPKAKKKKKPLAKTDKSEKSEKTDKTDKAEKPTGKADKPLGKIEKVEVRVPRREQVAEAQSKNVFWLYVAAALLLLVASAYYSGIIGH